MRKYPLIALTLCAIMALSSCSFMSQSIRDVASGTAEEPAAQPVSTPQPAAGPDDTEAPLDRPNGPEASDGPGEQDAGGLAPIVELDAETLDYLAQTVVNEPLPMARFETLEGGAYDLADYSEGTLILMFGATWCHYCKVNTGYFAEALDYLKDYPIEFAMIDTAESISGDQLKAELHAYLEEAGADFPVLMNGDEYSYNFMISGYPTTIMIHDGQIVFIIPGAFSSVDQCIAYIGAVHDYGDVLLG